MKVIKKFLEWLNIRPDEKQIWILLSMAISGLLITYSHPVLLKTIVSQLPTQWLAFEALISSITGLIIGSIWRGKLRNKAIKWFIYLAATESLCGFLLGMYLCFISFNVWVFAIASLIYTSLISMFVGKCIMYFKSQLWNEQKREIYDNNSSIVSGIVCVIGYIFALFAMPSLKIGLFLWGICCILDDIGWIIVVKKYIK